MFRRLVNHVARRTLEFGADGTVLEFDEVVHDNEAKACFAACRARGDAGVVKRQSAAGVTGNWTLA
jgi:hypothetical protein